MSHITAELHSGLSVSLSNGRHSWAADEPVDAGGTDTGPNPYELLLGSLAACTCLTIAMYCRHKGMTLNSIHASSIWSRECTKRRMLPLSMAASIPSGICGNRQYRTFLRVVAQCSNASQNIQLYWFLSFELYIFIEIYR